MPSTKGKPTDSKLREKVKDEIKHEPNKHGGGKGQWSAWKAAKLAKEFEKKGGSYENESGSKNKPKKGAPQPKSQSKKKAEESKRDQEEAENSSSLPTPPGDGRNVQRDDDEVNGDEGVSEDEKPKANSSKKAKKGKELDPGEKKKAVGRPRKSAGSRAPKKEVSRVEGTRKSARVAEKRKSSVEEDGRNGKKTKI